MSASSDAPAAGGDGAAGAGAASSSSKSRAQGRKDSTEKKKQELGQEGFKKYQREMKAAQRKRKREALEPAGAAAALPLPPPPAAAVAAAPQPSGGPLPFSLPLPPYGWLPGSGGGSAAAGAASQLPPLLWPALPIGGATALLLPVAPGLEQQGATLAPLVPPTGPGEGGTANRGSGKAAQSRAHRAVPAAAAAVVCPSTPIAASAAAAMEESPAPATDVSRQAAEASASASAVAAAAAAATAAALHPPGAPPTLAPTLLRCPQDDRCGFSSVLLCLLTPWCRVASADEAAFAQRWSEMGERIHRGPVDLPAVFASQQPSPFVTADAALVRSLHRLLCAYLADSRGSQHPQAAMLQPKEWQLTDGGERSRARSRTASTHAPFFALLEEREPAVKLFSDAVDYLRALVSACSTDVRYSAEFSARTSSRHGWMDSRNKAFEILAAVLGLSSPSNALPLPLPPPPRRPSVSRSFRRNAGCGSRLRVARPATSDGRRGSRCGVFAFAALAAVPAMRLCLREPERTGSACSPMRRRGRAECRG